MEKEKNITINSYSLASYYVDLLFNDKKISNATCFFSKQNGKIYLVTNWHVVSGKNADSFELLDQWGAIPNIIRVYIPKEIGEGLIKYYDNSYMDVRLYDQEENKLWYEMKIGSRMIDVAVIPIQDPNGIYMTIEEAEEPFNEEVRFDIASEIYIIGFPSGNQTGYIPIWKKASVASEPELDMEDLPYYFADTATKSGMSGSPVVLYKDRPVAIINQQAGAISRHWTKLVGIYSGRIGANSETRNDAQLGRVWKVSVIKDIINNYEK